VTWVANRLCAFDCESTGADVETARIVSAAVAFVGGGEETEEFTILVDPGVEIPEEATAVHGITSEQARRDGTPAPAALTAIADELERREPGCALVAMVARYDLTILDRELRRHGLGDGSRFAQGVVDPFVIDKHLDRYRRGSRKLDALCEHYGATLAGAHDACFDAVAAARVAWVIGKRGRVIRRERTHRDARENRALEQEWSVAHSDLDRLHAAQVRWAREQAVGLAEYFATKGEPQEIDGSWPLLPPRRVEAPS
jgi:DNA polymerase-3 subunit epsilon